MSSQEIKIGVSGDTGGAARIVDKVTESTDNLADALQRVDSASKGVNQQLRSTEDLARRLSATQTILSREFGKPVSQGDAAKFIGNFDRMRTSKRGVVGSQRLRGYDDFEGWYQGHGSSFSKPEFAARHRRFVMSVGMQGTDYARQYGTPPTDEEPEGPPEGGGGGGWRRAVSMGKGVAMGGLALAGLGSVMGTMNKALDLSTDETLGTDVLKRRLGDLSVDFEDLRSKTRSLGAGLGIAYNDLTHLSTQYAQAAGNVSGAGSLGGVTAGAGFARAFGLEPAEGVQMMAVFKRLAMTGGANDPDGSKLGGTIARAIEQSGFQGDPGAIVTAIENFASNTANRALVMPNTGAYMGALTALTGSGTTPGATPENMAAMLQTVDQTLASGGGGGDAGKNFLYKMLMQAHPGMSVFQVGQLLQGGAFGNTAAMWGPGGPLAGEKHPFSLNGETTISEIVAGIRKMAPGDMSLQDSMLATVTGINNPVWARKLFGAADAKSIDKVAGDYQDRIDENNPAVATRTAAKSITDMLVAQGAPLLALTNDIKTAVSRIADVIAPVGDKDYDMGKDLMGGNPISGALAGKAIKAGRQVGTDAAHRLGLGLIGPSMRRGVFAGVDGAAMAAAAGGGDSGDASGLAGLTGLDLQAAMNVMGVESSGVPGRLKPDAVSQADRRGRVARGIAQWRSGRQVGMGSTLAAQMAHVNAELRGKYSRVIADMAKQSTLLGKEDVWLTEYEGLTRGGADYDRDMRALGHSLPAGHRSKGASGHHITIGTPDSITLKLPNGHVAGQVHLKPYAQPVPAGG